MTQFIEFAAFFSGIGGKLLWASAGGNGMTLGSRLKRRPSQRASVLSAVLVLGASLAGCSGAMVADHLPQATGGLPQNTPPRPSTSGEYPAVHDMPPPRSSTLLSEEEQKKLEDELVAARKRAGAGAKPAGTARSK
jgi:hypothetical protein